MIIVTFIKKRNQRFGKSIIFKKLIFAQGVSYACVSRAGMEGESPQWREARHEDLYRTARPPATEVNRLLNETIFTV